MAQSAILVSVLFGLLLVATGAFVAGRGGRHYSPAEDGSIARDDGPSLAARAAGDPTVWTVAFIVTALAFGGATVMYVGETTTPDWIEASAGAFLGIGAALVTALYLFYGTFVSARGRGLKNAQAVALGSWAVGLLFIVAIAFKLLGVF